MRARTLAVPRRVRILMSVADLPIPLPPLPGGLDTPELVVFVDRVRDNIERLQGDLAARGVALRPHFKTHKSVRIARMQLDAGAAGLTVGTLGRGRGARAGGAARPVHRVSRVGRGPEGRAAPRAPRVGRRLAVGVESVEAVERLGRGRWPARGGRCGCWSRWIRAGIAPGSRRRRRPSASRRRRQRAGLRRRRRVHARRALVSRGRRGCRRARRGDVARVRDRRRWRPPGSRSGP